MIHPVPPTRLRPPAPTCLYCGGAATTRDHVPPKALLVSPPPQNWRTVPACRACNAGWSLDEEYLAVVLGHIGETPDLEAQVAPSGQIDRALARSTRFDDRLMASLVVHQGRPALELELQRVERVLGKLAFGLHALRYGRGPAIEDFRMVALAGPGQPLAMPLRAALHYPGDFRLKPWTAVQDKIFRFIFATIATQEGRVLLCFLEMHGTLTAVFACPPPISTGKPALDCPPW